jgi:hypothetical protein
VPKRTRYAGKISGHAIWWDYNASTVNLEAKRHIRVNYFPVAAINIANVKPSKKTAF